MPHMPSKEDCYVDLSTPHPAKAMCVSPDHLHVQSEHRGICIVSLVVIVQGPALMLPASADVGREAVLPELLYSRVTVHKNIYSPSFLVFR